MRLRRPIPSLEPILGRPMGVISALAWFVAMAALTACNGGENDRGVFRPHDDRLGDGGLWLDATSPDVLCEDDVWITETVLAVHCASAECHDAAEPVAGLDLDSPGVRGRLVAATSVHETCEEQTIIVEGQPQVSLLMRKVLGTQGECGDPMPIDAPLPLEAQRCLATWIASM